MIDGQRSDRAAMVINASESIAFAGPLEGHDDTILSSGDNHLAGQNGRDTGDGGDVLPDA